MVASPPTDEALSDIVQRYPASRDEFLTALYAFAASFVAKNLRNSCVEDLPSVIFEKITDHLDACVEGARGSDSITVYLWGLCRRFALDHIRAQRPHLDIEVYLEENPPLDQSAPPIMGLIADEARFRIEWALLYSVDWFRFPKYQRYYQGLVEHWIEFLEETDRPLPVPEVVWDSALYLLRATIACPDGHIFQRLWPHLYVRKGA